jgi:hypothetical protein
MKSVRILSGKGRERTNRSAADGGTEIPERELGGRLTATLSTVLNVAPASQQSRSLWVEEHHERLGQRIDLYPVTGLPLGRRWARAMFGTLDDPTESRIVHVDDPSAVARLNDNLIHNTSIP